MSRPHCCFFYQNHTLYLEANPSKFGTYIAPSASFPLQLTP